MNVTLLASGSITTAMFTLMMECTQKEVPPNAQATHYTILSTAEVLGKLMFATIASSLTDIIGYPPAYVLFAVLSAVPVYLLTIKRNEFMYLTDWVYCIRLQYRFYHLSWLCFFSHTSWELERWNTNLAFFYFWIACSEILIVNIYI